MFSLIDEYMGIRLDVDLAAVKPGHVEVVESRRRLQLEQSYGFIHALWWVRLDDGRSVVSVPPGTGEAVARILPKHVESDQQLFDPQVADRLEGPVNDALRKACLKKVERVLQEVLFACDASRLRVHGFGDCRRLTDESIPATEGLSLPTHCFPDGIAYGVVVDGEVVSIAFAHHTCVMEETVADLGVTTAPPHRRRRYAKTAVSAVVE